MQNRGKPYTLAQVVAILPEGWVIDNTGNEPEPGNTVTFEKPGAIAVITFRYWDKLKQELTGQFKFTSNLVIRGIRHIVISQVFMVDVSDNNMEEFKDVIIREYNTFSEYCVEISSVIEHCAYAVTPKAKADTLATVPIPEAYKKPEVIDVTTIECPIDGGNYRDYLEGKKFITGVKLVHSEEIQQREGVCNHCIFYKTKPRNYFCNKCYAFLPNHYFFILA